MDYFDLTLALLLFFSATAYIAKRTKISLSVLVTVAAAKLKKFELSLLISFNRE